MHHDPTFWLLARASGLAGYVVPSRLYGIMAAGRPVIVAADPDSETAQVVSREECGLVVPPDRNPFSCGLATSIMTPPPRHQLPAAGHNEASAIIPGGKKTAPSATASVSSLASGC